MASLYLLLCWRRLVVAREMRLVHSEMACFAVYLKLVRMGTVPFF